MTTAGSPTRTTTTSVAVGDPSPGLTIKSFCLTAETVISVLAGARISLQYELVMSEHHRMQSHHVVAVASLVLCFVHSSVQRVS